MPRPSAGSPVHRSCLCFNYATAMLVYLQVGCRSLEREDDVNCRQRKPNTTNRCRTLHCLHPEPNSAKSSGQLLSSLLHAWLHCHTAQLKCKCRFDTLTSMLLAREANHKKLDLYMHMHFKKTCTAVRNHPTPAASCPAALHVNISNNFLGKQPVLRLAIIRPNR